MDCVRDNAAHAAASARADGYAVLTRVVYEVPDDKIVVRETFSDDDVELFFRSRPELVRNAAVTLDKPVVSHLSQVLRGGKSARRYVRRLKILLFYGHVAFVHDFYRIRYRFGTPGEKLHHLFVRLHIEFVGIEFHTRRVVYRLTRLYAQKHVLHLCVRFFYVMHVVGRDDLYAYLAREADEKRIYLLLFGYSVILKLYIKIAVFEHVSQHYSVIFRALVVARQQKSGYPARKARRTADDALRMLFQKF